MPERILAVLTGAIRWGEIDETACTVDEEEAALEA